MFLITRSSSVCPAGVLPLDLLLLLILTISGSVFKLPLVLSLAFSKSSDLFITGSGSSILDTHSRSVSDFHTHTGVELMPLKILDARLLCYLQHSLVVVMMKVWSQKMLWCGEDPPQGPLHPPSGLKLAMLLGDRAVGEASADRADLMVPLAHHQVAIWKFLWVSELI
ncbi:hypothetical protein Tco_0137758 [Tanacetum coccineum]